jgi:hypothetical protein
MAELFLFDQPTPKALKTVTVSLLWQLAPTLSLN